VSKWEKVKLGDICEIERGGSPRPIDNYITENDDGVNWIKIGDTSEDNMFITETKQKILPEGMKKSRYVQPGDFLLTNSMSFGRPYILKIDGCIHDGWLVLRDKNNYFHKEYLYYALSSKSTYNRFKLLAVGGVVNNLNSKIVKEVEVSLPPLEVQKQVAQNLDTVSELLALRKKQLEELDGLIKSVFYDIFGDPVTNDKGWDVQSVSSLCSNIFGGGTPSKSKPEYYIGDIPWVTPKDMKDLRIRDSIDHINGDAIRNSSTKLIPKGSILMVIRSGILKRTLPVAINEIEVTINQDMKAFVLTNKVISEYLLYTFKSLESTILNRVRSVTADNIEFNLIKELEVPVPPIEMQNQFINTVTKIEEQKSLVKQSIEETQQLFDSLMSQYFD